ncbi:MAG: hypothetical protein ORN54_07715 [Cyclobacteriaceae bacterium]|nr:hypothetical protein [Cyclobacteriaceae bacterium]
MKKAATIIIILVSFICIGHTQPNSNYYWSGKRKISLVPDSTSWTLIPVRGYSKEAASSQIKNINMVSNLQASIGSELIDFTLKDHSKEAVRKLKLNLAPHGEITCRQLIEGKAPITLTGRYYPDLTVN